MRAGNHTLLLSKPVLTCTLGCTTADREIGHFADRSPYYKITMGWSRHLVKCLSGAGIALLVLPVLVGTLRVITVS